MKGIMTVENFRYGCKILLHRRDHITTGSKLMHYWDGYNFAQYNKWRWYFRYRQALLQGQYPKRYVELVPFRYDYVPPKEQQIKRLTDKMRAAKAKRTHYMKQIELAKAHWNEIFPIEEHPDYIRAMAKIEQKEALVIELENQIAELT